MKNIGRHIISILCIILVQSCNDSGIKNYDKVKPEAKSIKQNSKIKFDFVNQKTKEKAKRLYKDSVYLVVINYENYKMDSLNKNIFEEGRHERYLYYYKSQETKVDLSDRKISYFENKIKLDTFYAVDNNTIPLFDIKFSSKGENYINGILDDFVYIKLDDTTKVRVISDKKIITQKVFIE